jgi:cobyrinic acid a,c-diamide synthase
MSALVSEGLSVQPFKVGPDFIDPTHHTAICGRISRNLDPYMMGEEGILETFINACEGADIAVIEGVMGLYDGIDGTMEGSTAHVAHILGSPVLLAMDVRGMSGSANAILHGFTSFNDKVKIKGAIFNKVGSERHRMMIERSMKVPAVGWIPKEPTLEKKSRHLGLYMAHETRPVPESSEIIKKYCDLDLIKSIAGSASSLTMPVNNECHASEKVVIGVALDNAFCFYYRNNLQRLESAGAKLAFFSPMRDRLPDVDGIYIGGGYPELYLKELSSSICKDDIRSSVYSGIPVLAECGGLMYLCESITSEKEHSMAGIFPARAYMSEKIQALGYVNAEYLYNSPIFDPGTRVRGHEFHYSRVEPMTEARFSIKLSRGKGISGGMDGIFEHATIGTYTHAYFTRDMAKNFVNAAWLYNKS